MIKNGIGKNNRRVGSAIVSFTYADITSICIIRIFFVGMF